MGHVQTQLSSGEGEVWLTPDAWHAQHCTWSYHHSKSLLIASTVDGIENQIDHRCQHYYQRDNTVKSVKHTSFSYLAIVLAPLVNLNLASSFSSSFSVLSNLCMHYPVTVLSLSSNVWLPCLDIQALHYLIFHLSLHPVDTDVRR